MDPLTIAALVQGAAAIVIAWYAWRSHGLAARAVAESARQAKAAEDALAAANASTIETRRQAMLALVPFLAFEPPKLGLDTTGLKYLDLAGTNLGPGPAWDLHFTVKGQDDWNGPFRPTRYLGSRLTVIAEGAPFRLTYPATEEASLEPDSWESGIRAIGTGHAPYHQPLVTKRLLFAFAYQSPLGVTVTDTYQWNTDAIELPQDAAWRHAGTVLDPGAENGESQRVVRHEAFRDSTGT